MVFCDPQLVTYSKQSSGCHWWSLHFYSIVLLDYVSSVIVSGQKVAFGRRQSLCQKIAVFDICVDRSFFPQRTRNFVTMAVINFLLIPVQIVQTPSLRIK